MKFLKHTSILFACFCLLASLSSCTRNSKEALPYVEQFSKSFFADALSWENIIAMSKQEQRVNLYYASISNNIDSWLKESIVPKLQSEYGIELNLYTVASINDLLVMIRNERNNTAEPSKDSVDVLWIHEDEFYAFNYYNLLYNAFAKQLPNAKYFLWDNEEYESNMRASGIAIDYRAMPWHTAVFTAYLNRNYISEQQQPASYLDLYGWLTQNPGKFTYTKIPDSNGASFIESLVYEFNPTTNPISYFQKPIEELSIGTVVEMVSPGVQFLELLTPYLWKEGKEYPESVFEYKNLYQANHIYIMLLYDTYGITDKIAGLDKVIPTEKANFSKEGPIAQKSYLSISADTRHPAASMLLINELNSTYFQISKLANTGLGLGLDYRTLNKLEQNRVVFASAKALISTEAELLQEETPDDYSRALARFGKKVVRTTTENITIDDIKEAFVIPATVPNMHISWKKLLNAIWLEYIARDSNKPFILVVKEAYELVVHNQYIKDSSNSLQ